MDLLFTFFQATLVIVQLLFVGAAFIPWLIKDSEEWPLLPLLGVAIFSFLVYVWTSIELDQFWFRIAIFTLATVGFYRAYLIFQHSQQKKLIYLENKVQLLLVVILVCMPIGVNLGMSAFDANDEIYSWNFWAIQVFHKQAIDFTFTQSVYPQFFSHFIASIYLLFGGIEYQTVTKLVLVILPVSWLLLLASKYGQRHAWKFLILAVLIFYGVKLDDEFSQGLADPMMAVFLSAGVYVLINACSMKTVTTHQSIILATLFISISPLIKQAALPWAVFIFPVLLVMLVLKNNLPKNLLCYAIIPVLSSLIWLLTVGSDFHQNQGVINASMSDRSLLGQAFYSINENILGNPLLASIFIYFSYRVFKNKNSLIIIVYIGCLISLVLWLLFGGYDLRLGMHVFTVLWVLDATITGQVVDMSRSNNTAIYRKKYWFALGLLFVVSSAYAIKDYQERFATYSIGSGEKRLTNGVMMQSKKLFGDGGHQLTKGIIERGEKIWVGSNYIFGVFYGSTHVLNPSMLPTKKHQIRQYLVKENVDYVLLSSSHLAFGSPNEMMRNHIEKCKDGYQSIPIENNFVGLKPFKIIKEANCIGVQES